MPQVLRALQADARFGAITADADAATITFDCARSNYHTVTLAGNRTLALANPQVGQPILLILQQDATGGRTVTWFAGIRWAGGTAPVLTTAGGKIDVVSILPIAAGSYLGFAALNL